MKRQATGREKTFAKHMSDKGLQNTQRSLKTQQETKTADFKIRKSSGTSLAIQWSIPGWGTRISHVPWHNQNQK